MPKQKNGVIEIKALWDHEANVWVATGEDVPGLVAEADTMESLVEKLKILIPELLELNGLISQFELTDIPFHLSSERSETISLLGNP